MHTPSLNASRRTKKTVVGEIPTNWHVENLSSLCRMLSGGTPSRSSPSLWGGNIQWFSAKDMRSFWLRESEEKITSMGVAESCRIVPAGTILILVRGMTLNKNVPICITAQESTFNQDLKALLPNNNISGIFLACALESKKHRLLSMVDHSGHGTGRLQTDLLSSFPLAIPPISEQLQIAHILGIWDAVIERLEKLIAAKKQLKHGLMQQFLSERRRFEKLSGKRWQTCSLSDAFVRVLRPLTSEPTEVLSITARVGFVTQKEKFSKVIAGKTLERYVLLHRGEFAYNKGNSKAYPQGCIYRLDNFEKAAVPQVYICFAAKPLEIDAEFYKYYFESGLLNGQLMAIINTGVRNDGLLNLDAEDFFKIRIHVPPMKEQRELVMLFRALDKEITFLKKEHEALRLQKKGLMQKLLTGKVRVTHLLAEST